MVRGILDFPVGRERRVRLTYGTGTNATAQQQNETAQCNYAQCSLLACLGGWLANVLFGWLVAQLHCTSCTLACLLTCLLGWLVGWLMFCLVGRLVVK